MKTCAFTDTISCFEEISGELKAFHGAQRFFDPNFFQLTFLNPCLDPDPDSTTPIYTGLDLVIPDPEYQKTSIVSTPEELEDDGESRLCIIQKVFQLGEGWGGAVKYHLSPQSIIPAIPVSLMQRRRLLSSFISSMVYHGRRNYKDTNPLMSSLLVFLFGVVQQFCRVLNLTRNRVLNSCRIWSTTQLNTPPPPSHTLSVGEGGGVGEVREKVEGQQFTRGVENTNITHCTFSL